MDNCVFCVKFLVLVLNVLVWAEKPEYIMGKAKKRFLPGTKMGEVTLGAAKS